MARAKGTKALKGKVLPILLMSFSLLGLISFLTIITSGFSFLKSNAANNKFSYTDPTTNITFTGTGNFFNANLTKVVPSGSHSGAPLYSLYGHQDWDTTRTDNTFYLHFKLDGVNGKKIAFKHTGSLSQYQRMWYKESGGNWKVFPTADTITTEGGNRVAYAISPTFNRSQVEIATFLPYSDVELNSLISFANTNAKITATSIAKSPQSRDIWRLDITDRSVSNQNKKTVVVISGQHAYEMLGVRATDDFVRFMATDPAMADLLKKARVIVYPMVNIDGIAQGNQRQSPLNVDLNRTWAVLPEHESAPELKDAYETRAVRKDITTTLGIAKAEIVADIHNTEMYKGDHWYGSYEHPRTSQSQQLLNIVKNKFGTIKNSYNMSIYYWPQWATGGTQGGTAGGWGIAKLGAPISLTTELNQFNDGDIAGAKRFGETFAQSIAQYLGASTSEPKYVDRCYNFAISRNGAMYWPNGCYGQIPPANSCIQTEVPLTADEVYSYNVWVSKGKPTIPGCNTTAEPPAPTPPPSGGDSQSSTTHIIKIVNRANRFYQKTLPIDGVIEDGAVFTEANSSRIKYSGSGWKSSNTNGLNGSYIKFTTNTGDSIEWTTSANTVSVQTARGPMVGKMEIYVDGRLVKSETLSEAIYKYTTVNFSLK